jgi:hypothetical protein
MGDHQQAQRRAAADAFIRSLEQLAGCFEAEANSVADSPTADSLAEDSPVKDASTEGQADIWAQATVQTDSNLLFDLEMLADAVADIEQFICRE